jgi:hypothetical protein
MNPLLEKLENYLPIIIVGIALPNDAADMVARLYFPDENYFHDGPDIIKYKGRECIRFVFSKDETIRFPIPRGVTLGTIEEWIEETAWKLGVSTMDRFSKPADPDPTTWRERPGNGIGTTFCGIDSDGLPGSTGIASTKNSDLAFIAAKNGWFTWIFKPNKGFKPDSIPMKIARRQIKNLNAAGGRDGEFPGWIEQPDDLKTHLKVCYDFNNLKITG